MKIFIYTNVFSQAEVSRHSSKGAWSSVFCLEDAWMAQPTVEAILSRLGLYRLFFVLL